MKRVMFVTCWLIAGCHPCPAKPGAGTEPRPAGPRAVTFLSTSDSHYKAFEAVNWNGANRETIEEMNRISSVRWPEKLGGGAIVRPRGVVVLGDCIDDGDKVRGEKDYTAAQYRAFVADFGLDHTDGLLKYRVYEGWGNHDGPPAGTGKSSVSFQAELKKRNALRKKNGWLTGLSDNGLHYSWDWDDVHLVQLNIYPADKQNPKVRYNPKWHDPQGALSFLKKDLRRCVGKSGRPVVLMSHCGFDSNWWHEEDWRAVYEAAADYNVVLYIYGHTGTGVRSWSPRGEARKWTCINDGHTTSGFFVIEITGNRIRAGYRCKDGQKITKRPDGTFTRQWNGKWQWRHVMVRQLPSADPVPKKHE